MSVLSLFFGLFGCKKEPKSSNYKLSEITGVSISCGHMDYSYCYSFWIHKKEDVWLFDANCFINDHEEETEFENREVSDDEVKTLFEILEQNDIINYVENYKKPKDSPFEIMDETTYSFSLTFLDGKQYSTYDQQNELEDFFYCLAENVD